MANSRKSNGKAVSESPVTDLFEAGRHPSPSEKDWADKTLAPTLEKAPERPIGEPTGINVDEHDHARFTTISAVPIRRLYTQADLPEDWSYDSYLNYPGQPPYTVPPDRPVTRISTIFMEGWSSAAFRLPPTDIDHSTAHDLAPCRRPLPGNRGIGVVQAVASKHQAGLVNDQCGQNGPLADHAGNHGDLRRRRCRG